jgi:cellulose synthase/poly-beta-1,6-N-acetylglucosamine synthase-like glycosyltransferase
MTWLEIVFWCAAGLVLYAYLGFPLLVLLRGLVWRRPYARGDIAHSVSLIIAAHNEAGSIAARIENILTLDYPRDRLEVLIASDGSSDGTDAIVRGYAGRGIRLLSLPRHGKVAALNAAASAATGDILVFSDANSMYAPNALGELVKPFADPAVGGVAGNQVYLASAAAGASSDGERTYWSFDRLLKNLQSRSGNVISATGAIYAIRRELFRPAPAGVMDDFVISTGVIAQGRRLVFAPDAIAYEPVAGSNGLEFGRKVRNIVLGLCAVWTMRELFNPLRHGSYALQLFSHKVLRRLVIFPLLVVAVTAPLLWQHGVLYQATTLAQAAFYGCAVLGLLAGNTRLGRLKFVAIPFFFCMVNVAALVATLKMSCGYRIVLWQPQREPAVAGLNAEPLLVSETLESVSHAISD